MLLLSMTFGCPLEEATVRERSVGPVSGQFGNPTTAGFMVTLQTPYLGERTFPWTLPSLLPTPRESQPPWKNQGSLEDNQDDNYRAPPENPTQFGG